MNVFEEVSAFYQSYRGEKRVIGYSALDRPLYAVFVGAKTGPQMISQYAIHGREWITALLSLYHVRRGLARGGAWVLPLSNPDGALLSEVGAQSVPSECWDFLKEVNGGGDFSLWKANAEAVDLNVNFDADWGCGASNVRAPAPENYIGPAPFSAPETAALRDFTREVRPDMTVSWHTKGEEIYWSYHQPRGRRLADRRLAAALSASTGYPLVKLKNSAGGYKDWCIKELKISAFTVEAGSDELRHPLGREALGALIGRTVDALFALAAAKK